MKNFLDPIANAKTAAFFLIVIGVIGILQYPALLLNPATYSQPVFFLFGFLSSLFYIIAGIGLRKVKLWGFYCFLGLTAATLFYSCFYLIQGYQLSVSLLLSNLINILLSVWFYSAKNRFKK